MTAASLQTKWMDAFLRAATGLRSVECVAARLRLFCVIEPTTHRICFLCCLSSGCRYVADSFPLDAKSDLEAFSNDICESASGWGGASLDAEAGCSFWACGCCLLVYPLFCPCVWAVSDTSSAEGAGDGPLLSPQREGRAGGRSLGRGLVVNVDVDDGSSCSPS